MPIFDFSYIKHFFAFGSFKNCFYLCIVDVAD